MKGKLIQKIVGVALGLTMAIGVGVAVGNESKNATKATSPATLNFEAKCNGSGTDSDGNTWTVTSDGTESAFDNTKGIHYGTGSAQVKYIRLSTSGITGTITQVVVNASTASGVSATVGVKVNNSQFGGNPKSLTSSATNYTFTGSSSGSIEVEITKPSAAVKAIYCKSIAVTYSSGDTPSDETIDSFTFTAPSAYTRTAAISLSDWKITPTLSEGGTPTSIADYLSVSPALSTETVGNFNATVTYDSAKGPYKMSTGVSNQIAISYTVNPIPDSELEFNATTYKIGIGSTYALNLKNQVKVNVGDSPINYAIKSGGSYVSLSNGVVTGTSKGDAVVTATKGSLVVDLTIQVRNMSSYTDTITRETTGVDSGATSYSTWSNKQASDSSHSEAVYAGNSAGNHDSVQLRSTNPSGIVSTGSGGLVGSVTINFNSNTSDTRTIQVYGSNTSYTGSVELYTSSTQGTLLGEVNIDDGASQTINVSGNYQYVGIRSKNNAIYLDSIVIVWVNEEIEKTVSELTVTTNPTKMSYAVGETLSLEGIVVTASFEEEGIDPVQLPSGDYTVSPVAGYKFTTDDATAGEKEITITYAGSYSTVDDEPVTVSFDVAVTPAKPSSITRTSTASWNDDQTLAQGSGRWKVTYTDESTVSNIKIGDEKTTLKIDGVAVNATELAKNYINKQATLEYTDQGVTLTNSFTISVTVLLSVDSIEKDFDYLLTGGESATVSAAFTSVNGEPDSYSVVSSNSSKLAVTFDESTVQYDSTAKTGTLSFDVTPGNTQGAYTVTVSVTKDERTESKSLSITVRGEAPTPSGVQYTKITSLDDVTTGKYVVTANVNETYYALPSIGGQAITAETVTVTNDVITENDAGLLPVDITKNSSTEYSISKSGTYITFPSSGTNLGSRTTPAYYSMSVSNGIFKINSSGRGLVYRTSTYNVWRGYANSNVNGTEYFGLTLFKQVSSSTQKEGFDYVQEFVDGYMYMDTIAITDKGSGACKGENGYYLTAKRAWNTMITTYNSEVSEEDREDLQEIFETSFVDAYTRYMAWASACGDKAPFTGTTIQSTNTLLNVLGSNSSSTVIIVVSILSLSALGGYYFLRRRKEQ